MKRAGILVGIICLLLTCFSIQPSRIIFAEERYRRRTQEAADNFRRWRDTVAERMTAAIRGGVKFGVGTDVVHGGVAKELEYLVQ